MSERDGYEHGIPCWVDHSSKDPAAAASFYGELFGWETEDQMPPDAPGKYFICRLRGRDVAAVGSQQAEDAPPSWNTYIWVESADETAGKVAEAGGQTFAPPFDVFDAGRMAVCADPAGAVFCLWQAGRHRGAQLVNEPGTLTWNELLTRDPEGCKRFYATALGWQISSVDYGGMQYTLWHAGEPTEGNSMAGMMDLAAGPWPAEVPPHWLVYFAIEDTDGTAGRCEELGGAVAAPGFDTPAGRIAVLNDPLGTVFSVIQPAAMSQ